MGIGVVNVINIFDPSLVVIGSPIRGVAQFMMPGILDRMWRDTLPEIQQEVQVKLSAFGQDASVIGVVAVL